MRKENILQIYTQVIENPRTKQELATTLNLCTKSIELAVKKIAGDIVYSKKLGKYHIAGLLPELIPTNVVIDILNDITQDNNLFKDTLTLLSLLENQLIKTTTLSPILIVKILDKIQNGKEL